MLNLKQPASRTELVDQTMDRFWETVPPLWREVRARVHKVASERYGISMEQFLVLRHLGKGAETMGGLAEVRQISRPAMTQAVEALVEKGLVERMDDPSDRRIVRLRLTAKGDEMLASIFGENRRWMADSLAMLDEEELGVLNEALRIAGRLLQGRENGGAQ